MSTLHDAVVRAIYRVGWVGASRIPPAAVSRIIGWGSAAAARHNGAHVQTLRDNARYFRERIVEAGFSPLPGETPIIPIIVGETSAAIQMSEMLLDEGVFVTGFGFPVVPQGEARVRCQISAAHTRADLDEAIAAFNRVGRRLKLI